jgi:hypothetical protein
MVDEPVRRFGIEWQEADEGSSQNSASRVQGLLLSAVVEVSKASISSMRDKADHQ